MMPSLSSRLTATLVLAVQICAAQPAALPQPASGQTPPSDAPRDSQVNTTPPAPDFQRSFGDWRAACEKLPSNRSLRGQWPRKELLPLRRFSELDEVLWAFFDQCKGGPLSQATNWVGHAPRRNDFFNTAPVSFLPSATSTSSAAIPFQPFAQKLSVPESSEIFFRADLHGDIRSLMANLSWLNEKSYLRGFSIARTNFYMIFLGDYTDRGAYGVEVLYTLLRLKVANRDRVFLTRGNHEDVSMQSRYGFLQEGWAKYGDDFNWQKIGRAFDFFPVVSYAGTGENFIQCNHGGMEPGFSAGGLIDAPGTLAFQLLGALNQKRFLSEHPEWLAHADKESRRTASQSLRDFRPADLLSPDLTGFAWNDFAVQASDPQFVRDPLRAFIYGERSTQFLLNMAGSKTGHVRAVFRGHQQSSALNPMMRRLIASRGIFRHWQAADSPALLNASVNKLSKVLESDEVRSIPPGSVWTFNVSPDSVYGQGCGYSFDSFGILTTARDFADWRLQVVNLPIMP
jgi:hypothetical protein